MPCYLIYGEDTFSSRRKLGEIRSRFFDAQMGDINITTLNGENVDLEQLKKATFLAPFLAQKRLIIIKNFLNKEKKDIQEKVADTIEKVPPFSILVFYQEGKIDKSLPLFKKLNSPKCVEEFPLLSSGSLLKWVSDEIKSRKGKIDPQALNKLIQIIGPDLWRASSEIDKLISFRNGEIIRKEDVELLVKEEIHPKIFDLVDSLGERNVKKATTLLSELLQMGENESYILSMIAYQFRNLLIVKDLIDNNKSLSLAKLHPFVLEKTKRQTKNFTKTQLLDVYGKLVETDYNIKNGNIKPNLALDLLLSELIK